MYTLTSIYWAAEGLKYVEIPVKRYEDVLSIFLLYFFLSFFLLNKYERPTCIDDRARLSLPVYMD